MPQEGDQVPGINQIEGDPSMPSASHGK
jgi:hypothetical protein